MPDISLDLETYGLRPGYDIKSIGAVLFNPLTGKVGGLSPIHINVMDDMFNDLSFYRACENPLVRPGWWASRGLTDAEMENLDDGERDFGLRRDPKTAEWWSSQSKAARAAFTSPFPLNVALNAFANWLKRIIEEDGGPVRIWSHGAAFDGPILEAAYIAIGGKAPWHYRSLRDTRTLFDAAGIIDHSEFLKLYPGPMGIPHHALDDAVSQALAVNVAWRRINMMADTMFAETGIDFRGARS